MIFSVQSPGRIENLVPAMFGIHLGKHHELCFGRIAWFRNEPIQEVLQL